VVWGMVGGACVGEKFFRWGVWGGGGGRGGMKMVVEKVYFWQHFVTTGGHQHCEQIPIKSDGSGNMMAAFSSIETKVCQVSAESEEAVPHLK